MDSSFPRMALTMGVLMGMLNCVSVLYGQGSAVGVRGGVGTDIHLGIGFGVGAAFVWNSGGGGTAFELGGDVYYNRTTDSYTRDIAVNGEDKTTLTVLGVRANALFNYHPSRKSVYFIAGFGFVVASLRWEENENWSSPLA